MLKEAKIIIHCFSFILRILKGKQYNDRLKSLYNPANLEMNAAKTSEKSDMDLMNDKQAKRSVDRAQANGDELTLAIEGSRGQGAGSRGQA
ncbi:MAG: hypothetical protein PUP93_10250 [Rhizonema sp. NSF051]|nr:hypothetical protein [Rhizonema sp. NSF051]